jgi:hypothetical protein
MLRQRVAFLLVAAVALGMTVGPVAILVVRIQGQAMEEEMRTRGKVLLSFGQACTAYAIDELRPAVQDRMYKMVSDEMFASFIAGAGSDFLGLELTCAATEYRTGEDVVCPLAPLPTQRMPE